MAGRRTIRLAIRPHAPLVRVLCMVHGSSFSLPKAERKILRFSAIPARRTDKSAGRRVSPARSMTLMPMASGTPRLE
jgi:hypothetical protein